MFQVFKALYRRVHPVAVKVLKKVHPIDTDRISIMREVAVLRACRHSHIVQVIREEDKQLPMSTSLPARITKNHTVILPPKDTSCFEDANLQRTWQT
jgi:serine/threonine protein kinase